MNKHEWIESTFANLREGESCRGACDGRCWRVATGGERPSGCDLHVRKQDGSILFNCFSASCGLKGKVHGRGRGSGVVKQPGEPGQNTGGDKRARPPFTGATRALPRDCLDWLAVYNITRERAASLGFRYDRDSERLIIPVTKDGTEIGTLARDFRGGNGPKWYNNIDGKEIYYVAPQHRQRRRIFMVEAAVSALHLAERGDAAIAILGARPSDERLSTCARIAHKYDECILWLDPDVPVQQLRTIKNKLTRLGCSVTVVSTDKKPKYYTHEEIEGILND